jgi:hypothetical protein
VTRRRKALWAILILLTTAVVAVFASLPAVARRLLTGPKLRVLINARPQDFFIDWEEASSPRLGHVTLKNLTLRGSDPNVQWFARVEKLELEYSLLALLRRSFQARDVRGSGLSFALRSKLPPGSTVADAAVLPPIPGFSDPPLKSPDDHFFVEPRPWLVDLRNVSIDRFEDIWVNNLRYQGPARLQGGLQLRPLQMVRIEAAAISLEGGQLHIGDSPGSLGLSGSIVVSSRQFEPLRVPLPELPGVLTADLNLDVRAETFQTLDRLITLPAGAKLEGGAATAGIRVASKEGVLDGTISLSIDGGQLRLGDAPGRVGFSGTVVVSSRLFELKRVPVFGTPGLLTGEVKLDLRVDKLKTLEKLVSLPAGAKIEGGAGTATIRVAVKEGIADGKVSVALKNAAVRTKNYRIHGDAAVDVPIRQWKLSGGPWDVSGTRVALTDVYSTGDDPKRGWWGTVDVPSGRVGKTTISAKAGLRCRDARPLLGVLGVKLPGWADGLVKLDDFSATANLMTAPETMRVTDLDAKGGTFHILGQFSQDGTVGNGAFLVQSGILLLGIEVVPPKPAKVRLLLAKQWYEKQVNPAAAGGK